MQFVTTASVLFVVQTCWTSFGSPITSAGSRMIHLNYVLASVALLHLKPRRIVAFVIAAPRTTAEKGQWGPLPSCVACVLSCEGGYR